MFPTILGPLPVLFHAPLHVLDGIIFFCQLGGEHTSPMPIGSMNSSRKHPTALETCARLHSHSVEQDSRIRESLGYGMSSESSSHLTGRHNLQRPEGGLEIGSVALELVKSGRDAGLQLGRVLARRAVGRDLVELRGRHVGRLFVDWREREKIEGLTVRLNFSHDQY